MKTILQGEYPFEPFRLVQTVLSSALGTSAEVDHIRRELDDRPCLFLVALLRLQSCGEAGLSCGEGRCLTEHFGHFWTSLRVAYLSQACKPIAFFRAKKHTCFDQAYFARPEGETRVHNRLGKHGFGMGDPVRFRSLIQTQKK